jgi:hypothetical protein
MTKPKEQPYRGTDRITPELTKHIAALVQLGTPVRLACQEAGIPRSTALSWLNKGGFTLVANDGRIGVAPEYVPPEKAKEPFKSFVRAIEEAQGLAYGQLSREVYKSSLVDANLGLKLLKSVAPDEFDSGTRNNVSVEVNAPHNQAIARISYSDFKRLEAERNAIEANGEFVNDEQLEPGPLALPEADQE